MNMQPIIAALQAAADRIGTKAVAAMFGHSRQYVEKVLNPEPDPEDKRHLPLEYAIQIMKATGDITPLSMIAARLGYRVVPLEVTPDKETVQDELLDDYSSMHLFAESVRGGDHPAVVRNAADKAIQEIEETYSMYHRQHAAAKEGGNHHA